MRIITLFISKEMIRNWPKTTVSVGKPLTLKIMFFSLRPQDCITKYDTIYHYQSTHELSGFLQLLKSAQISSLHNGCLSLNDVSLSLRSSKAHVHHIMIRNIQCIPKIK